MRLDFTVVFSNLLGLFLLIGAGILAARLRILPKEASPYFSTLLLKITLPCTIFISLATKEYDPSFIKDSLLTLGIGLIAFPAMQLLGSAGARLLRVPEGKRYIPLPRQKPMLYSGSRRSEPSYHRQGHPPDIPGLHPIPQ